jgi:hypothetical protein
VKKKTAATGGSGDTFLRFMVKDEQRKMMVVLLVSFALLYIVVKLCYPDPIHCLPDASGYIHAAVNHWKVNYRPYGYPALLNLIHGMNRHMWFLTFAQYVFYVFSLSFFIFTIQYLFPLDKVAFHIFTTLCIVAPVALYFTNYAISDSVFSSLTILWITTGIWLLHRRKPWIVVVHLVTMLLALHVKYAGLIYPFLSAALLVLAFSGGKTVRTIAISAAPLLPLAIYYNVTVNAVTDETGVKTFAGFSGWSLANNSVAVIPFVNIDKNTLHDPEIRLAHHFISRYPDSVYRYDPVTATAFIWDKKGAGKALMNHLQQNNGREYFSMWVYTGRIWGKYGNFLIRNYPVEFTRYFIFPNLKEILYPTKVYLPPCNTVVSDLIKERYGSSQSNFEYRWDVIAPLQTFIRICNLLGWLLVVAAIFLLAIFYKKLTLSKVQKHMLVFASLVILFYVGFIAIGHPFEQRYGINIHVLKIAVPVMLFSSLYTNKKKTGAQK